MKKFILFAIMLLTFCSAVAYGDKCDDAINEIQKLYQTLDNGLARCDHIQNLKKRRACKNRFYCIFDIQFKRVSPICIHECWGCHEPEKVKYCSQRKGEASITPAERPAYDKFIKEMRESAQAAVSKNRQNRCPTCSTNSQNSR